MEEKIKTHTLIDNIFYYLGILKKVFPVGILLMLLSVPVGVFIIYQTIKIPRIIIAGVETSAEPKQVLFFVFSAVLVITICKMLLQIFETCLMTLGSRSLFYLYSVYINKKIFELQYQTLISAEVRAKLIKVKDIVMAKGNCGGLHFFPLNFSFLLTAVIGICVFTLGIIRIDGILFTIILSSNVFNLLYGMFAGKYTKRNIYGRSPNEKKENYIIETTQLIVFTHDIFAYIYLIYKLSCGVIAVSQFVFLIGVVMEFSKWTDNILSEINNLIIFNTHINQIRDFLDIDDEKVKGNLTEDIVNEKPAIEFKNVSYRYSEAAPWIFKDFNLKINSTEKLAVVGMTGAGKTTLIHLLMGLLEPAAGEILIDGKKSSDFKKEEYYALFSPVFQDIHIFPETIASNIAGSKKINDEKLNNVVSLTGLTEMLKTLPFGKETFLVKNSRDDAVDLSGEQSQRMLFARSLYKNAKINLFDEPAAALEPITESRIYKEYDAMSKDKTVIFISHRLDSIKFCPRIIFLEHGKIIEEGCHDSLMKKNAKYREMYEEQSKYYAEETKNNTVGV